MTDPPSVNRDTPLRLVRALELAFPEGGMTVSGLRREIGRGRLEAEIIAGKTFVTLSGIERMRERCRVQRTPPASRERVQSSSPPPAVNAEVALAYARRQVALLLDKEKAAKEQAKRARQ